MTTAQSSTGATYSSSSRTQHFPPTPRACNHQWSSNSKQSCLSCIREHASHTHNYSVGQYQSSNETSSPLYRYRTTHESMSDNITRKRNLLADFTAKYENK